MVIVRLSVLIGFVLLVTSICGLPTVAQSAVKIKKLEETPGAIQGDMFYPPTTQRDVAVRGIGIRWTNGIVPYEILPGFETASQQAIIGAMRRLERAVAVNNIQCVQFRPKIPSDLYSIKIVKGIGCSSYVGQPTVANFNHYVTLQDPGCIDDGRIMHELLHTLGFLHEQSRPDRDSYVRVITENISPGYELNFIKYGDNVVDTQSTPYDYGSVMHYERDAFSRNGLPTIEPLQANVVIGQRITISPIDILEVQMFYGCLPNRIISSRSTTATTTTTTTTTTITTKKSYSRLCNPDIFLNQGESLTSDNGLYFLAMQHDGNLCMYRTNAAGQPAIWCTMSYGKGQAPYKLAVQTDGNLVIYGQTGYIWATMTHGLGTAPYCLILQDDRNLVLYDRNWKVLWYSKTNI